MENNKDMEDLFKKSFDNYEPEVRPKVWENVKVGLKWGSLGLFLNALMNKVGTTTLIALASTAIAVIGTVSYVSLTDDGGQETTANKPLTTPVITADSNLPTAAAENTAAISDTAENNPKADITDESVATISANMLSGTAPLIVDLSNTGTGKTNKWVFSNSKKASTVSNTVHVFEKPGKYSVKLISTDAEGKEDVDIVSVEVVESVPTIYQFSPDGDGASDTLKLAPKGAVASIDAKIFDIDGNLIYKTDETKGAYWAGEDLQGKDSPKGNYYIVLNATTPKGKKVEQKGIVKLVK